MAALPSLDGVPIGAYGAQWGGSGYNYDPSANPRAQQWMDWMRTQDPSARWQEQDTGGQHEWVFTQDHPDKDEKYPDLARALKPLGGGQTLEPVFEQTGAYDPSEKPHAFAGTLNHNDWQIKTPIGRVTPTANIHQDFDIGTLAPAAIGLLATALSGGAASPLLISALTRAPQMLSQMSDGNFGGGAGMLASIIRQYATQGGGG